MQDSSVIAIVSVSVSGAIGLLGLGSALFTSRRDREHTLALAREERKQARLADAYLDMLLIVQQVGQWAEAVLPVVDSDPPAPDPDLPDAEVQFAARARVTAFGSPVVRDAIAVWEQSLREVRARVILVRMRQARGGDDGTPWMDLEQTVRPAEKRAREALEGVMASELSS